MIAMIFIGIILNYLGLLKGWMIAIYILLLVLQTICSIFNIIVNLYCIENV